MLFRYFPIKTPQILKFSRFLENFELLRAVLSVFLLVVNIIIPAKIRHS
nr:MAG TPA: hypothetical protein [Caudoviricetes sp.]